MKTLLKDTLKEVKNSFGRFVSILLIIALGVGFFSGIKATAPDMKNSADAYFDEHNLMDFSIISTMGFDEDDVLSFKGIDGIDKVNEGYSLEVLTKREDKEVVTKLISLPKNNKSALNKPILVEGRLPNGDGECLLEASDINKENYQLGSKIKLESGGDRALSEDLENDELKVVGFANLPQYITYDKGTSTMGNGKVENFIVLGEEEFRSKYYTDLYLGIDDDLNTFSDEYKDRLDDVKKDLEALGEERREARVDGFKDELNEELEEGRKEIEEEKEKGMKELEDAKIEIDNGRKKVSEGEDALSNAGSKLEVELKKAEAELDREEERLNKSIKEYEEALVKLNQGKLSASKEISKAKDRIARKEREVAKAEAKVKEQEDYLSELERNINLLNAERQTVNSEEELKVINGQIQVLESRSKLIKKEVEGAKLGIAEGKKEIKKAKADLESTGGIEISSSRLKEAKARLDAGKREIAKGREKIKRERIDSKSKISSENIDLEKAKLELKDAEKKYEEGLEELNIEVEKAERELGKLEGEIDKLEKPEWFIIKRTDTKDYNEFEMGADRIDSVAKVFPLFFLLIALLVCLTTMARMVDEQRGYIGTLKALGYGNGAIMSKYMIYSLIASLMGSAIGLLIGFKVFPTVIFNAYRMMFIMPEITTEFNLYFAAISTLAAILTTTIAVFFAVRSEVRETPALLMRPKAPKVGKRIFLERITPIWERMKFSQKVTARNLFRYKRRLFMTIIGIAGCTALLVAGFGLRDSIMDVGVNQFDVISNYDMAVDVNDGVDTGEDSPVLNFLNEDRRIESYMLGREENIEIKSDEDKKDISLIVVENGSFLNDYIRLSDRKTEEKIDLDRDSIVLTEKMGDMLGVAKGDSVTIVIDDEEHEVVIKDLTENYAFHYVYMTQGMYEDLLGEGIEYNKVLAKTTDTDEEFENRLSNDILRNDEVSSVLFITGLSDSLNDTMDSLNNVILVLIITAGALAFVVLYNLTNINISERMRELATIKVLGFYDNEVSSYVYRENNILTIMGILLGFGLGLLLHQFIIITVEIEMIMFGRVVRPISLLYSALLTIAFALLVNFVMHFRLKKIDMVESMKSID